MRFASLKIMALTLLYFSSTVILGSAAEQPNYLVRIQSPAPAQLADALAAEGFDVAGKDRKSGTIEVVTAFPHDLIKNASGLNGDPVLTFSVLSVEKTKPYQDVQDSENDAIDGYLDTDASWQRLQDMAAANPQYAQVINLNDWLGVPQTVDGQKIMALKVGATRELLTTKSKILYIGQHHARELMTHHTVLDLADLLLKELAAGNQNYVNWMQDSDVWFVPIVNPDGLKHVFSSDRMWRKNRSHNNDGSRGVDLNRNYAFKWGQCGQTSSQGRAEIYFGPTPNSEPETTVMDRLNQELHFQYALSFHSAGDEVLSPYLCGQLAEGPLYQSILTKLSGELGFGTRVASGSGEDFEHHYAKYGTIAFLLEIGSSFQPPFKDYRDQVWPTVKKTLAFMLEESRKPSLTIKTRDAQTGAPLKASLSLDKISFREGEVRETDALGLYHWRLLPNTYQLSVKAPGYESQLVNLTLNASPAEEVTVALRHSP